MSAASDTPDLESVVRGYATVPGGLMPALHAVHDVLGYVPVTFVPVLADVFNLSVAEVHGVITYYKDFRTDPTRGPVVQVCRAEACQSRGGAAVWAAANDAASGRDVEVDEVFCLGLCAQGPSVRASGRMHVGVTARDAGAIVADATERRYEVAVAVTGPSVSGRAVYVPSDVAARAVGADDIAAGLVAAGVHVVRTGTRGMLWLEPMIEVDTDDGRVAYGPVAAADVDGLIAAGLLDGADHPLRLGYVDDLSWMHGQHRITFARSGVVDPRSATSHEQHGGLRGLRRALSMTPGDVVTEVTESGVRGRGGAAFPTGIKLRTVLDTHADAKYVMCNADEGDSGAFADRMLMEGDPMLLLEGMAIAGWSVGANDGYVYIRSEYPDAVATMTAAVDAATTAGWLGDDVLGSGFAFRVHIRVGAGSYVCGEETALMESIEGKRGIVRAKPPLPAISGLWGKPTVSNNVLSIAALTSILADGAAAYAAVGFGRSRGTQVVQLAGNVARGGIIEVPFGITVRELIDEWGGGTASGRPVRTVQIGGPLGSYLPEEQFDLPVDYEAFAAAGALLGHGSIVVFDDTVDMLAQARFAMEFCAIESCGKCTPCRIGSIRGVELLDAVAEGRDVDANLGLLVDLCEVMADASLCAMGGFTPLPVRSALEHFTDDFQRNDAPTHDLRQGASA